MSLYEVTSCLDAWSHVPSRGVSVSDPRFLPGRSLSGVGIYVQGVSLSRGLSVWDTPRQRPMYGKERAIHILLEFFLISDYILVEF